MYTTRCTTTLQHVEFINNKKVVLNTECRLIDSLKFLSSFLNKLTKNLEIHQFKELSKYFPKKYLNLDTRKLAYAYEYNINIHI